MNVSVNDRMIDGSFHDHLFVVGLIESASLLPAAFDRPATAVHPPATGGKMMHYPLDYAPSAFWNIYSQGLLHTR